MLGGRCHGRRGWVGASSSCPAPARDGRQLLYLLRKDKQRPGALRGRVLPRSCRKGLVSSRATTAPCCASPGGAWSQVGTQNVGFSLQREAGKGTEAWSSLRSPRAKCGYLRGGLHGGQVAPGGTELLSPHATNIQLSGKLEAFPGCRETKVSVPCVLVLGAGDPCKPCHCSRQKIPRRTVSSSTSCQNCLQRGAGQEKPGRQAAWGSVGMPPAGLSPLLCHSPGPPRTSRCCGDLLNASPPPLASVYPAVSGGTGQGSTTSTRASGPGSAPGWMLHIQVHVCV